MGHDRRVDRAETEADEDDGGRVGGERVYEPYGELEDEGEEDVDGESAPFAELLYPAQFSTEQMRGRGRGKQTFLVSGMRASRPTVEPPQNPDAT